MKYISTRGQSAGVSLSQAMQSGLAGDGGLYVPEHFPTIHWQSFNAHLSYPEFAQKVLAPFFVSDPLEHQLKEITHQAFNFDVPVKELDSNHLMLELFHGPTLSFKDFGARFLANSLARVDTEKVITIIVATSGDTGSAVAAAFHNQPNIRVVVMFPEGKISKRQEQQITCWSDNVLSVGIQGAFDDCQALVKSAFNHHWWHQRTQLNTSNSINIGRLLPQITYYAYTSWQYYLKHRKQANYIVPTGNIGNVCAAFWAKTIGFPIDEIVLSQNENNTIGRYLQSGVYQARDSIETLANAMDVGKPSNLERLFNLFQDFETFKKHVRSFKASDQAIKDTIKSVYERYNEMICPHTATAFYARQQLPSDKSYIMVATADPAKFESIIEPVLDRSVPLPARLEKLMNKEQHKVLISADMDQLCSQYDAFFSS